MILAYVAIMAWKIFGLFDATTNDTNDIAVISRYFLPAYRALFLNLELRTAYRFYLQKEG